MIQQSVNYSKKINWCKNQSKGIKIIEPNSNLAETYFNAAKETINLINHDKLIKSNIWLATHKYYFLYYCTYSILMKIGIKSEIHECTIALIKILEENNILNSNMAEILEQSKNQRINNQYYLKNETINVNEEELNSILLSTLNFIKNTDAEKIIVARELIFKKNKT